MAKASLNREYAIRFCAVGIIMIGISLWSLYDGMVAYPRENERLAEIRKVAVPKNNATNIVILAQAWITKRTNKETGEQESPLELVYRKHGWKQPRSLVQKLLAIQEPKDQSVESLNAYAQATIRAFSEEIYPQEKISVQYGQAAITFGLALFFFWSVWKKRKMVYEATEDGLGGSGFGGEFIPWGKVKQVDWSKWDEKGILTVFLVDGRKYTLDGWHFKPMRPIAEVIQEQEKRGFGSVEEK